MTQEEADKIFETDLGRQLEVIYVTSDDRVFIRYEEAVLHTNDMMNADPESFVDTSITEWYPRQRELNLRKGLKEFYMEDGTVVWALNEKNAIRKFKRKTNEKRNIRRQ